MVLACSRGSQRAPKATRAGDPVGHSPPVDLWCREMPPRGSLSPGLCSLSTKQGLNETAFLKDKVDFDYPVRFDHLTVGLWYQGHKIGPSDDTFPSFYLQPQEQRAVQPTRLQGQASDVVGAAAVAEAYARDRGNGWFEVVVRIKTTLTYRSWPYRATYYYDYDCPLRFDAPPGNGTPAVTRGVKCQD